ncbi:hypothetical protein C1T31_07870 [Hanstruepera neustonica]|uniref:DUF192 domain-containing protein n=1 Tax=Hanstruepera neustonica TaxID=1445657 RepID=A0A2K1DZG3_9FLAO|nr:DUF192 domain-containing protein [Hanstruepera neustonica]PNQ73419.1 hypothetical protein C1T31_07870 [Hanstruepera neustonica]
MIRQYFRIAILSSSIILTSVTSCKDEPKTVSQKKVTFKKEGELQILKASNDSLIKILDIEIADNEFETQTGLMYRESMNENHGMLFVFDDSRPRSFYMKNTRFPLDIIYLDDKKTIVSFQENAQPLNENSLPSNAPAKYVLEVNAGLVKQWNLQVGDKITYTKQ